MPLSRARSAVIALLLAVAGSPSAAEDAGEPPAPPDNAYAAAERRAILVDADPGEAAAFLAGDQAERARQVGDQYLYAALFQRAAELENLRRLLLDRSSAPRIRRALEADPGCAFCRQPSKLRAWARSRLSLDGQTESELDRALVEWSAMPASFQTWARARGYRFDSWEPVTWDERVRLAVEWSDGALAALRTRQPRTRAELAAAWADAVTAGLWLGNAPLRPIYDSLRKAERTVTDPAAAFDGDARPAGEPASATARAATSIPLAAAQAFDAPMRQMAADLLKPALLDEMGGTQGGDGLRAFYRDHPLRLRVAPLEHEYAQYNDAAGIITIDEKHLLDFLAERDRLPRDLALDGQLLHEAAMEWAANFVHEATHQRQQAWAAESGVAFAYGVFSEQEAIQEEALYALERRTRDRAYAAYLDAHRAKSSVVREDARLADVLERRGAAELRAEVLEYYYREPSLELGTLRRLAFTKERQDAISSELERRKALAAEERSAIEERAAAPLTSYSNAAFREALPSLSAAVLESWRAGYRAQGEGAPQAYQAYRKRIDDTNAQAQRRLQALFTGAAAPARGEPPAPAP